MVFLLAQHHQGFILDKTSLSWGWCAEKNIYEGNEGY